MGETDRDGSREAHLERSRRVWDLWSRFYGLNDRDTEPIRRRAIETLDLADGDTVLDVGCGPGSNFELLRARVGPGGRVLGVDYSPRMAAEARSRVAEYGWRNVDVIRADATRPVVPAESVDAAVATLAISAMPDATAAVERLFDAIEPGGRVAVYDVRPVPEGPLRVLNPVIGLGFRWLANRCPDADVLAELEAVFADVSVVETYAAGTNYVATGRKPPD